MVILENGRLWTENYWMFRSIPNNSDQYQLPECGNVVTNQIFTMNMLSICFIVYN